MVGLSGLLPDRSYNASVRFLNIEAPASFTLMLRFARAVGLVSIIINSVLISITVSRVLDINLCQKKRRGMVLLLLNLVASTAHCIWIVFLVSVPMGYETCLYMGVVGAPMYLLSNEFKYMVLYWRATAIEDRTKLGQCVFTAVKYGTLAAPGIALLCPVLFQGIAFFKEEFCIQDLSPVLCWSFLAVDSSLSFAYLYVFLEPVLLHLREIKEYESVIGGKAMENESNTMQSLASKNLFWSSLVIMSTFAFMTCLHDVRGRGKYDPHVTAREHRYFVFGTSMWAWAGPRPGLAHTNTTARALILSARPHRAPGHDRSDHQLGRLHCNLLQGMAARSLGALAQ